MQYSVIVLPTRPQPDTLVAVFILKTLGEQAFPGIKDAGIEFWQVMPEGATEASLAEKGIVVIDIGKGRFDHHGQATPVTASELIAHYLEVADDPALTKLLEYAERDDFYGKGIISSDPIDRAFGLSALVVNLNKLYVKEPGKVISVVFPILEAHYAEEVRRTKEMPREVEEKTQSGAAETFAVRQGDKNLKVIIISSDNISLPGFLRSQLGGRFDIVAQQLSSGHLNILTRPTKRVDLRSLAAVIRRAELTYAGREFLGDVRALSAPGRVEAVPEWYFDPATNSIQNGGVNPKEVPPTKIARQEFKRLIEEGLGR